MRPDPGPGRPGARDRLQDWAYAAGWGLVKAVPHRVALAGFRLAADVAVRRQGTTARQLAANLRRVAGPDVPPRRLAALTRAGMRSYARYWCEMFRLPVMDRAVVSAGVQRHITGTHHLDEAYRLGRGVVLVLPHSGNWDAGAVWLIDRGMPFTTVVERLRPESLYRRFVAYREGLGMEVLPLTGGERSPSEILAERLAAGGVVCLVGDRDLTASGIEVDFFGEAAKMPAGPALLAVRTGAPLVPVGMWFEDGGWGVRVHAPVDIPEGGSLRQRVQVATQHVADAFAADIARHPADWHMVQRLWLADLPGGGPRASRERAGEPT